MESDNNVRVTEPDADLINLFPGESLEEHEDHIEEYEDHIEEYDEIEVDLDDQIMSSPELEERTIPIRLDFRWYLESGYG